MGARARSGRLLGRSVFKGLSGREKAWLIGGEKNRDQNKQGKPWLGQDLEAGADGSERIELGNIVVAKANATCTGRLADQIFPVGPMNINVTILAGKIVRLFAVEPKDAGQDEILFFYRVGRFPNTACGAAADEVSA